MFKAPLPPALLLGPGQRPLLTSLALLSVLIGTSGAFAQEVTTSEVGLTAAAAAAAAASLPAIGVSEVALATLRDRVVGSGLVAAVEHVQVQPLINGQPVDALLADVGDRVEAGQVLARLSTTALDLHMAELTAQRASAAAAVAQAEASLAEAAAAAAEANRVAARSAQLAEQGALSRAQAETEAATAEATRAGVRAAEQGIAAARAQGALLEVQVATLELELARTEVRAPVAGLVVARNAQVGAVAAAGVEPMFTLVRDGAMEMRADVSERDVLRLAAGQPVTLTSIGLAAPLTGTVRLVEPSIDLESRLGRVRVAIDDPSQVVDGMFLTAEIVVAEADILAVPATAVSAGADGPSVLRVREGLVERVPVTAGVRDGDRVGVTAGLAPGDLIVSQAAAFVREGDTINPIRDQADAVVAQLQGP